MKICLLHCKITFHFMRKKHLSCTWALLLKLQFRKFLTLRKKLFSICGLAFSSLLSCTKHSISVLRSKLVILRIEALTWLALQKKLLTHENLSSALHIAFHFMRKKHLSCTWALLLTGGLWWFWGPWDVLTCLIFVLISATYNILLTNMYCFCIQHKLCYN